MLQWSWSIFTDCCRQLLVFSVYNAFTFSFRSEYIIFKRIQQLNYEFPAGFFEDAKDMVEKLLVRSCWSNSCRNFLYCWPFRGKCCVIGKLIAIGIVIHKGTREFYIVRCCFFQWWWHFVYFVTGFKMQRPFGGWGQARSLHWIKATSLPERLGLGHPLHQSTSHHTHLHPWHG